MSLPKKQSPRNQSRRKVGQVSAERALSKLGLASRTQARAWILEGRVKINGVIRKDPLFAFTPEKAKIEIDGKQTQLSSRVTLALHKPRGTITSRSDEKGRPTVFECISPPIPGLHAVGRLDWATSGLLILTHDTQLSAWLTDPENSVVRSYVVTVRGEVTTQDIQKLMRGILDEGELLIATQATPLKVSGRQSTVRVQLTEGKNREIRRMFASLGHEVTLLKRIAYGGIELGELRPGEYRELTQDELKLAFPGAPIAQKSRELKV